MYTITLPDSPFSLSYRLSTPADRTAVTIDPAFPTVLFVHPPWVDSFVFYPQYDDPALYSNYNLLSIDLPGHGSSHVHSPLQEPYTWKSAAETLYQAIGALQTGPVHVVGSGVGCLGAMHLAIAHPEVAESLTLVGPSLKTEPELVTVAFEEWLTMFADAAADKDVEALEFLNAHVFEFCTGMGADPALRDLREEYGQLVDARLLSGELERVAPIYISLLKTRNDVPSVEEMGKVTCPVLIVEATEEKLAPESDLYAQMVERVNETCFNSGKPPGAARHMLEGAPASRWITLTHPDPVNSLITEFLKTKSPASLPPSPNTPLTPCVARRPSTPRDVTGFTILPPPKLEPGRKTLGEMMDELERNGKAGVNVEVEVLVQVDEE
ncbi:hypothetical protein IAT38_007660 [Cryptococcus sp. DSM 104549]